MGKKDKNKKKVSGTVKTAMKTEKKLNAKQKKELAALGEDDIEKVVAQIEKEEARRQRVVETIVEQPTRRVNFTLTAHPFKDELIMLGGEFYDGQKTVVYGDMFFYNLKKKEWSLIKAPGAPPPRCGHQAVAVPTNNGELWVFGGEFSSPSESQFYHYRDLWVYRIGEKKWEKITSPGGPSARSGHRMVHVKKQLIVFGGFHDNLRDYKYYNDVHIFNLTTYKWNKLDISGNLPAPRSGCIVFPTTDNKILIYGGYSKERIKKDVDKGQVHKDMFTISPEKNDQTGLKWKSVMVKQGGIGVSPRCSASGILVQPNQAYMFGGVFDEEENEEELHGTFFNDLISLDLEKFQWHTVTLSGKKESSVRRRRRKIKEDGDSNGESEDDENDETSAPMDVTPVPTVITDDDGIFTVTVGPSLKTSTSTGQAETASAVFYPSPRINAGLVLKHEILYLYGGMFEDGDRQYTLNDFYSLDTRKLDEWKTIIKDDLSSQVWLESDSSDSGSDDDDDDDDKSSDEEDGMEVDDK
ncbi:kelch domain-containing protein 4 [Cephus cinctus]|uniref:Kelch domain-containing protein 4 n=1 Tax=Cephus cinctus TaxID=211228 RepID=A0AAJ7BI60_CEPCN|nr:kelch domain-containing protein 4 [Cephus cinctus]